MQQESGPSKVTLSCFKCIFSLHTTCYNWMSSIFLKLLSYEILCTYKPKCLNKQKDLSTFQGKKGTIFNWLSTLFPSATGSRVGIIVRFNACNIAFSIVKVDFVDQPPCY